LVHFCFVFPVVQNLKHLSLVCMSSTPLPLSNLKVREYFLGDEINHIYTGFI